MIKQNNIKQQLEIYLVMGSQNCKHDPVETLKKAIQGGVTFFQFREKGKGSRTGEGKIELGLQLKEVCHQHGVPFIVNDDLGLAIELDADGLHIGQEDGDMKKIKDSLKSHQLFGVSTHNVKEALEAHRIGVDYIGVGPMFNTATKDDIEEVRGPVVIKEIREQLPDIPLVGIGGIKHDNASQVIEAGADGVAVISDIAQADVPMKAAEQILKDVIY
ncbi:thiamine phosphate synthase [Alkalibacillus haloalkaliphilus]|uniref:Thiamine-phosphate synthase n=1 Tax=Alkalibacillus haloalkaliphilus TaxID=94136 RepID=A0A511W4Y7_9BACI|nr:thiamine phosphate synthase [Alkalibacillus haloalkaliphilus]GEN46145.1 thiamine-phosphate synthase [Alkalibacillus haloalkaliphilus]